MPRKPFEKGKSGNPKGRPPGIPEKTPRTLRRLAAQFLEEHGKDVIDAMKQGIATKGERVRVLAVLASLEKQHVEHSAPKGGTFVLIADGGKKTTIDLGAGG